MPLDCVPSSVKPYLHRGCSGAKELCTEVEAVCNVSGPNGSFQADVLLDGRSVIALKQSQNKAHQLGLPYRPGIDLTTGCHGTENIITHR